MRGVQEALVELKSLEDEGDRILRDALASLFRDDRIDPLIVIRWKDIYEALERALDACETAANVIANIARQERVGRLIDDLTLVAVVVVALFFDFTNGFHDTANSIATSVSTRALSPRNAVAMAAILNFVGAFISFKVAATIAKGIVDPDAITLDIILAGLVGAITWNLVTWYLGLPSSSSHALIGGVDGLGDHGRRAGRSSSGRASGRRSLKPSLIAPFAGLRDRVRADDVIVWLDRAAVARRRSTASSDAASSSPAASSRSRTARTTRRRRWGSSRSRSSRPATSNADFTRPPTWVIVCRGARDVCGHVRRRLADHPHARNADREDRPAAGLRGPDARAPSILWTTAHLGFPVSTTHVISGSVMGAGATRGLHAVRWGVAGNILVAWIFTIPMAGPRRRRHGARHAPARRRPDRLPARGRDLRDGVHGAALGDAPPASAPA